MSATKFTKAQLFQELQKDAPEVHEKWSLKAQRGVGKALLEIADYYCQKGEFEKEIAWNKLAAEKNVPHAFYRIGYRYFFGDGVPQNYLVAIDFYIKAVKGNHKTAKLRLAQTLKNGCGVIPDKLKALEWYYRYDRNHYMIDKLEIEGYVLEQKHKDKLVAQLIKETEDIIGKEKERCTLPKDVDLADLGQTRESFQNDFSHLSEQIDMLAFENCLLKDQIQVQSDMINAIKISQDAAIMYVQEKKSLENKFNHELAEKDKKIRFLQNTTENLVRLMEKMKQEREETNKVVLLGISSCTSRDIDNQMDNMSVMEGTQK